MHYGTQQSKKHDDAETNVVCGHDLPEVQRLISFNEVCIHSPNIAKWASGTYLGTEAQWSNLHVDIRLRIAHDSVRCLRKYNYDVPCNCMVSVDFGQ
jgi:hypothetical protein